MKTIRYYLECAKPALFVGALSGLAVIGVSLALHFPGFA